MKKKEDSQFPKAVYSGELDLNGFILSCAVLEDGTRLFSERSLATAFGIKGGGAYWEKKKSEDNSALLPEYLSANYLEPFISSDLRDKLSSSFSYVAINGTISRGIDATVLPDICDVYVEAKNKGVRNTNLIRVADTAYKLIKGFAKVGIIALVDEATGYQYDREHDELQKILKAYVSDDILNWQKTFHDSFYREIFRLRKWNFTLNDIKKRPGVVGTYTNKYVYDMLPPGVLQKIKQKTPKSASGHYLYKFHQSLTPDTGREHLRNQLVSVTTLLSVSRSWEEFQDFFARKFGQTSINFDEKPDVPPKDQPLSSDDFNKSLKGLTDVPPPDSETKSENDSEPEGNPDDSDPDKPE